MTGSERLSSPQALPREALGSHRDSRSVQVRYPLRPAGRTLVLPLARRPEDVAVAPDWAALDEALRGWQLEDRSPGLPTQRWERFLGWCQVSLEPHEPLALALAYLGSRSTERPGAQEWEGLLALLRSPRQPSPYDVALAWAAGWRQGHADRPFSPGSVGETAVLALVEQVHAVLRSTLRMLALQTGIVVATPDETPSMAGAIGMSLLGVCDCGHHVRPCVGRCGRGCCFPDHDLRAWDPTTCYLRAFVDQAVRGTAQRRVLGGAFAESMLYRLLAAEGRLLCRTVEWGRCEVCGRAFEGSRCPSPHQPAAAAVRREPRKNQLIVPAVGGGAGHVPVQRWWCGACRHLFGWARGPREEAPGCPRCGGKATASKAVWTLDTSPRVLQLQ